MAKASTTVLWIIIIIVLIILGVWWYFASQNPNTQKSITSFAFTSLSPQASGVIDDTNSTVNATVPSGTDVTNLTPAIQVSDDAIISPSSGVAQDFTNPVIYTVTAQDGSTQSYTVTVQVQSSSTNQSASVTISNFAFTPGTLTVKTGTKVTWTNQDTVAHTVTGDNGGPASTNIAPGDTYSYTFDQAGTFSYHCSIHPSMKGTVTVTQ